MTITCPVCLTKFHLDEERIPEGGAKARCSICQHVFQVQRPVPPEELFFPPGESPGEFEEVEKYEEPSSRHFLWWKWAIPALLIIVVAAGLIFYFEMGRKGALPFSAVGQYLSDKATVFKKVSLSLPFFKKYFGMGDHSEGFFSLEKVRGYYLESPNLNKVFVIEGEAVNHWKESRSFIKVRGVLLDSKGNKVREQEVYCGNILSEKDLKEMSRGVIEKSFSSQFGISFSNVNLLPNKSVPFMIVFLDLTPAGMQSKAVQGPAGKPDEVLPVLSDFTVEVTSSQKGSK
jgi:predicted Zn finger-like uncharacterized protein